jgi:hypothetical protein
VIAVCVIVPLLLNLRMPFTSTKPVRDLYDTVERIPSGSVVYVACDYDPGSMPELHPMTLAIYRHLFSRNVRVVSAALWAPGPPLIERAFRQVAEGEYHKQYGVDYVNLGFKEGREVVMVAMANSIPATFSADYYGTPIQSIPLMRQVHDFSDVRMIISISAGYPGTKEWVQQIQSRFHVLMGAGCTAVSAPEYYPYYQSGQLVGLLGGMKGAAEYEALVGKPGLGSSGMVAQSTVHLLIIVFILFGNVAYLLSRRVRKGES